MPKFSCKSHVKDYCSKCTFAGVHFIADDEKHWIERLLWTILVILSWCGSALLISAAWDAFVKNPISFGLDTTYLDWKTKFPTVAVCDTDTRSNKRKVQEIAAAIWPSNVALDDVLIDIAYFRGQAFAIMRVCLSEEPNPLCPVSNYSYYANFTRNTCPQVLANCSYNDVSFDCCEYFQPIETDIGICYIINSLQTKNPKPYPVVHNIKNKRGILRFKLLFASMVYILGEDEVPNIATLMSSTLKVSLGKKYRRQVVVKNIVNHPLVADTTHMQRSCRFHYENEDGIYPLYSYSACNIRCRKQAQIKYCQCNDHLMVNTRGGTCAVIWTAYNSYLKHFSAEEEHCNLTGIACLHENFAYLANLKPKWAPRPGLVCDCLPSCNETEISTIEDTAYSLKSRNAKEALVEIVLAHLPTERFKRNVVRSRLDLVVSVGGTAGLFVGASLLSFVELIFFFTVRLVNNILMEKRKQNTVRRGGDFFKLNTTK